MTESQGAHKVTWSLRCDLEPTASWVQELLLDRAGGGCILMARMILVCLLHNTNIGAVPVHRESLDASLFPGFSASEIPVLQETVA